MAVLDMADGCRCVIDACKYGGSRYGGVQVVCEQGQLIGSQSCNTLLLVQGRDVQALDPPAPVMGLPCALMDLAQAIAQDREPSITGQDGLAAVTLAQACYESAAAGRPVTVG